jgi:hypothetical protein
MTKSQLDRIEAKLDAIIEAFAGPPPKGNPKERLSKQIRRGFQRQQAAFARARKPVGKGRGAVGSQRVKRKLEREAGRKT